MIVHCAAVIAGTPEETLRVNVDGTRVLVEAALRPRAERFLYMSTIAAYALSGRDVVDESTPDLPNRRGGPSASVFPISRARAGQAVWTARGRGLAVTMLRPPNILGVHPSSRWSALLAQRMLKGEHFIAGDGSGSWAYVHVDNLIDAVVLALSSDRAIGEAYNVIDGQTIAAEYFRRFRRWLGLGPVPTRGEISPWRGSFSAEKIRRELGYSPRVSYEEAMAENERYLTEQGLRR